MAASRYRLYIAAYASLLHVGTGAGAGVPAGDNRSGAVRIMFRSRQASSSLVCKCENVRIPENQSRTLADTGHLRTVAGLRLNTTCEYGLRRKEGLTPGVSEPLDSARRFSKSGIL